MASGETKEPATESKEPAKESKDSGDPGVETTPRVSKEEKLAEATATDTTEKPAEGSEAAEKPAEGSKPKAKGKSKAGAKSKAKGKAKESAKGAKESAKGANAQKGAGAPKSTASSGSQQGRGRGKGSGAPSQTPLMATAPPWFGPPATAYPPQKTPLGQFSGGHFIPAAPAPGGKGSSKGAPPAAAGASGKGRGKKGQQKAPDRQGQEQQLQQQLQMQQAMLAQHVAVQAHMQAQMQAQAQWYAQMYAHQHAAAAAHAEVMSQIRPPAAGTPLNASAPAFEAPKSSVSSTVEAASPTGAGASVVPGSLPSPDRVFRGLVKLWFPKRGQGYIECDELKRMGHRDVQLEKAQRNGVDRGDTCEFTVYQIATKEGFQLAAKNLKKV